MHIVEKGGFNISSKQWLLFPFYITICISLDYLENASSGMVLTDCPTTLFYKNTLYKNTALSYSKNKNM